MVIMTATATSIELLLQCQDNKFKFNNHYSLQLKDKLSEEEFNTIIDKLNETYELNTIINTLNETGKHGPSLGGVYKVVRFIPIVRMAFKIPKRAKFHGMYSDLAATCEEINKSYTKGTVNLRLMEKEAGRYAAVNSWTVRIQLEDL
eukprot:gene4671-14868_t